MLIVDDTALGEPVEATVIAIVFLLAQSFLRISPKNILPQIHRLQTHRLEICRLEKNRH